MEKLVTFNQLKQTAEASMTAIGTKQNKLSGAEGQIVGFDAEGNAIAQVAPDSGITQAEADGRYLQLSGGKMSGKPTLNQAGIFTNDKFGVRGIEIGYSSIPSAPTDGKTGVLSLPVRLSNGEDPTDIYKYANFYFNKNDYALELRPDWAPLKAHVGSSVEICGVSSPTNNNSAANKQYVDERLPSGVIVMWSGTAAPTGWALCDGTNGTPDLRGRFILGASETHELAETGGEETHTLTIDEMPKHDHAIRCTFETGNTSGGSMPKREYGEWNTTVNVQKTGGGTAHNNMPPYYVLAYIMKL